MKEMNRFNLSGGRAAALMIGSLVIATASMVVLVVVVAGAQTATDSTIPASHQEHEGGMGHGGNHDGGGHGAGGHEGRLAATAEYQGLDPGSLKSQLTEGAEIAGDDLDGLFARQLAVAGGHIGQAVTDGRIDQARADEMLARDILELEPAEITERQSRPAYRSSTFMVPMLIITVVLLVIRF